MSVATVEAFPDDDARSMIGRVALILRTFEQEHGSLGVSEITRRTGLPKSTVARIVGELVKHSLLERDEHGVRLGIRMFELGESVPRRHDLRRLALPCMADLRASLDLTIHLAVLEGTEVVYVEILRARSAPALATRIGGRLPAYSTGVGKALLAWSAESVVRAALARPLVAIGPGTITSPELLRAQFARIRAEGVSFDREESRPGISSVATAALDPAGSPVLAISAVGRSGDVAAERVTAAVRDAGRTLSRALGRHPRPARLIS
jgi:DNA-binding IclR family transcriptional regulator